MSRIKLIMVVRDVEPMIERCIRSAAPLLSSWFIIDTGSVDQSPQKIWQLMYELRLPGELVKRPWVNHMTNRSELLRLSKDADTDYCLMLDADMELVQEQELPELSAESYALDVRDRGLVYPLPLLTSTKRDFFYEGVAHSYLTCEEGEWANARLRELSIIDHGGGPGNNDKFERDREALAAEVVKNPLDRRSWFYLAQTYRDLGLMQESIACYRMRASLGGWDEEVYNSLYQGGSLCCEHMSAVEGMTMLLDAWKVKPGRAEALRALSKVATNVADQLPFPSEDMLFVRSSDYKDHGNALPASGLEASQVSAVLVTRGDVDMQPILDSLPFDDVVIWDNSKRDRDLMIYGRYEALKEVKNQIVYWQDDDIVFTDFEGLLAAYEPGKLVCNMDEDWIQGAGYADILAMVGAGSLCDVSLPEQMFALYFAQYPLDEEFMLECDFVFGSLVPFKRVDLGYGVREFADDPDRLYQQPGQTLRKWNMIKRAKELAAA